MDLSKLQSFRDNELNNLVSLVKIYREYLKIERDNVVLSFYRYSTRLTIIRINELLNGELKLNTEFCNLFEAEARETFKSNLDTLEDAFNDKLNLEKDSE